MWNNSLTISDGLVSLVALTPDDVTPEYVGWLNDPKTNRFLEVRHRPQTLATVMDFVAASVDSSEEALLKIMYSPDDSEPIDERMHVGTLRIHGIDNHHGFAEVGLVIGVPHLRGRGLGQRALRLAEELSRTQLSLRKLTAGCYRENRASLTAFLASGFSVVGSRRDHFRLCESFDDLLLLEKFLATDLKSAATT